jgi:apolipoprotein D and lipocalin family protein
MNATGFVKDPVNQSIWGMQFVWPIKADYRVIYVDKEYQHTVIGREKRDFLWIMARNKPISIDRLNMLIEIAVKEGYTRDKILLTNWQKPVLKEAS